MSGIAPGPEREERWEPDVLPGFERLTLPLAPDDEGDVVATLVRRVGPGADAGVDLLYVHGWIDYFFQTHLADFWEGLGVRFHALDLRKYGRSLRDHQTPGYTDDLAVYDEDIEAALRALGHAAPDAPSSAHPRKLLLMGHSTGGLTLALWADRHPGRADALVLNSPWLEFQTRYLGRRVLEGPVRAHAAVAPRGHLVNVDQGFYVRSISRRYDGEWDYDTAWRPDSGWRATPAWLAAVFDGHERVAHGLGVDVPILVLLSARSTAPVRWHDDMLRTDSVLDVPGVARRVPHLGSVVTLVRIDGALHDVTLSAAPVREVVWRETARWFHGYVAPAAPTPTTPRPPWWRRLFAAPGAVSRSAAPTPPPGRSSPRSPAPTAQSRL
ncbi:alpha/beta hydrolase [Xylanimonas ulmi]|uniref:Alpha-beta hydrolase superfamily lysophospholipase n=1 Tax=Xylanimonas ulmi TaxID=228973 RepID=A0A4Q7M413_9MICO|nr:alpha/beta hydrolase [Xylanibacterium ulmi]RZS62695.1 alpha-beta hydrolase superfamily lysophospholipase [Xylanibacterium ulmi]